MSFTSYAQSSSRKPSTVSSACSRIASRVFSLNVSLVCIGTVTRPRFVGCLKIMWLPRLRTWCHPSCFNALITSTAVIRGSLGLIFIAFAVTSISQRYGDRICSLSLVYKKKQISYSKGMFIIGKHKLICRERGTETFGKRSASPQLPLFTTYKLDE